MKKKNGFIATSLIYSFFLIFITLFLTIIADYLQDRVLLNTIEDGIKTDLNSQMTINDFDLGDYVQFYENNIINDNIFVVASINPNNKSIIFYHLINSSQSGTEIETNFFSNTGVNIEPVTDFFNIQIDDTTKNKILDVLNCTYDEDYNYNCTINGVETLQKRKKYTFSFLNYDNTSKKIIKDKGSEGTIGNPFRLKVQ